MNSFITITFILFMFCSFLYIVNKVYLILIVMFTRSERQNESREFFFNKAGSNIRFDSWVSNEHIKSFPKIDNLSFLIQSTSRSVWVIFSSLKLDCEYTKLC